ncbi:hypothetical protein SK128_010732 [Halocaridina rubra]|uniref:Uncharacterized protein n=1 Tax=Halocaridina rubra TaxID=373956 RepID=A0AAN8XJR3_HALRR
MQVRRYQGPMAKGQIFKERHKVSEIWSTVTTSKDYRATSTAPTIYTATPTACAISTPASTVPATFTTSPTAPISQKPLTQSPPSLQDDVLYISFLGVASTLE